MLEADVLPARIGKCRPADLDLLCAAGEIAWIGIEPLGPSDGRIALFLVDQLPLLSPAQEPAAGELVGQSRALFEQRGALFFSDIVAETGAFPADLLAALRDLARSARGRRSHRPEETDGDERPCADRR